MKNILLLLFISFSFLLGSCEKESKEIVDSPTKISFFLGSDTLTEANFPDFISVVEANFAANSQFVNNFVNAQNNGTVTAGAMAQMISLLGITENLVMDELLQANIANNVSSLMTTRQQQSDFGLSNNPCDKLVVVRNAMLDECDNYVLGISTACRASVMIAYWWKSRNC